jgi:hypothetical protein
MSDFFKTYKHIIKTILYSDGIENLSDKDKKKLLNRLRNNPLELTPGPPGPPVPPPATVFERIFEETDALLTGSWKQSANGGSAGKSLIANGSGGSSVTASLTYTFSNDLGIPSGDYDLSVKSVNSNLGYRSNKVYSYIDTGDERTPIHIDQTDSMTDGKWIRVGNFKLTAANGVVTYSITNRNVETDRYVSADAIKIKRCD